MKKKDETLREKFLCYAQEIAEKNGIGAINMRLLAKKAKTATGTVYNYFSSKDEIFLTLTEKYRHKIIEKIKVNSSSDCFYEHLRETFEFLNEQIEKSAGKLMTNLGKMESIGQSKMAFIQSDLKQIIVEAIDKDKDKDKDKDINPKVWNENFSKQ